MKNENLMNMHEFIIRLTNKHEWFFFCRKYTSEFLLTKIKERAIILLAPKRPDIPWAWRGGWCRQSCPSVSAPEPGTPATPGTGTRLSRTPPRMKEEEDFHFSVKMKWIFIFRLVRKRIFNFNPATKKRIFTFNLVTKDREDFNFGFCYVKDIFTFNPVMKMKRIFTFNYVTKYIKDFDF